MDNLEVVPSSRAPILSFLDPIQFVSGCFFVFSIFFLKHPVVCLSFQGNSFKTEGGFSNRDGPRNWFHGHFNNPKF